MMKIARKKLCQDLMGLLTASFATMIGLHLVNTILGQIKRKTKKDLEETIIILESQIMIKYLQIKEEVIRA